MAFGIKDAVDAGAKILPSVIGAFGIGQRAADRRQLEQQEKLQKLGISGSKELLDYQKAKDLEMWKATNWGAQMDEAEKAGLSRAWLMSGGGGGTSGTIGGGGMSVNGGSAADAASTENAGTNKAMAIAQMANIAANTEKTKAETANLAGQGANTQADTAAKQWMTDLSKKLNTDEFIRDVQSQQKQNAERLENENQKWKQEFEAWEAAGFAGMQWDDPNTPMAKAMRAGWEKTITEAENAKKTGNVLDAEKTIKQFEANLTRQGIAAGSPWYVKIVGDLLGKLGISLTGDTAKAAKK